MSFSFCRCAALALALSTVASSPTAADLAPAGSAHTLCREADRLDGDEKAAALARGLELAGRAVKADPNDADAHFALFCNLGKRLRHDSPGLGTLSQVRRLRRSIDRALELRPDDPNLMAAKGALLVDLPAMLGGDDCEGERLLRQALALDANNRRARAHLANVDSAGCSDAAIGDQASDQHRLGDAP
ncbi:MAG TPA: hypothetical protein VEB21_18115 [Terriglobales bacterium]|nr:hypothetical protein [Terriglobales bacterium]